MKRIHLILAGGLIVSGTGGCSASHEEFLWQEGVHSVTVHGCSLTPQAIEDWQPLAIYPDTWWNSPDKGHSVEPFMGQIFVEDLEDRPTQILVEARKKNPFLREAKQPGTKEAEPSALTPTQKALIGMKTFWCQHGPSAQSFREEAPRGKISFDDPIVATSNISQLTSTSADVGFESFVTEKGPSAVLQIVPMVFCKDTPSAPGEGSGEKPLQKSEKRKRESGGDLRPEKKAKKKSNKVSLPPRRVKRVEENLLKNSGKKEWLDLSHGWVNEKLTKPAEKLNLQGRAQQAFVAARNRQRDRIDNMLYKFLSDHNFNLTKKEHSEIKKIIHSSLDERITSLKLLDPERWSHIED